MAKIKQNLGSISKCDVKDVWSLETDFSDWLSESKNLQALCDTLGIEPFDTMERESSVGAYRADIVGTLANGRHVIIENQWGKTNHDHLGKVITYASGKDASVIIWIAESYDDEHSSAIEWLNNISNDTWFFLVMIELIRIGDSEPAPLFNVIQRPNNYIQMQNASLSDTDRVRYEFWGGFIDAENIIAESVKPCEDTQKAYIIRLYESTNTRTSAKISFAHPVRKIEETDMLEQKISDLDTCDQLKLAFRPFEIKTIKVYY